METYIFFEIGIHKVHQNLMRELVIFQMPLLIGLLDTPTPKATIDLLVTVELETEIDAEGNLLSQDDQLSCQQDSAPSHYLPV